jgi:hypothetical protein
MDDHEATMLSAGFHDTGGVRIEVLPTLHVEPYMVFGEQVCHAVAGHPTIMRIDRDYTACGSGSVSAGRRLGVPPTRAGPVGGTRRAGREVRPVQGWRYAARG